MDTDRSVYWPKLGDSVSFAGTEAGERFKIVDVVKEFPCTSYLIKSTRDGRVTKAFRHQLDRFAGVRPTAVKTTLKPSDDTVEKIQLEVPSDLFEEMFEPWTAEDPHSDLDDEALDAIDTSVKPKSTISSESWAMKTFDEWQIKRGISVDFATVTPTELAANLRKFYAEVKTKSGNMMAPSSLRGIRAGLHRKLTSPPYRRHTCINILSDREFTQANKMLESVCKLYVNSNQPKSKHYPAIEKGDMTLVDKYLKQYELSPENLLHTFWFLLAYYFARRGREGWRNMTTETFSVKKDDTGREFLSMDTTERNKNWQGGSSSKAWDYSDVRAYANSGVGDLNIVTIYKLYTSKLHPDNNALFQKPKPKKPESGPWFDNVAIGVNTLGGIMKTISKTAGLSQSYTNHSVRATAITVLYQGGVDTKAICKISKHKTEESLKHYIDGQSSDLKRKCSDVLQAGFIPVSVTPDMSLTTNDNQTTINTTSACATVGTTEPHQACSTQQVVSTSQHSFSAAQMASAATQHFHFNVTGGTCNINFTFPPTTSLRAQQETINSITQTGSQS